MKIASLFSFPFWEYRHILNKYSKGWFWSTFLCMIVGVVNALVIAPDLVHWIGNGEPLFFKDPLRACLFLAIIPFALGYGLALIAMTLWFFSNKVRVVRSGDIVSYIGGNNSVLAERYLPQNK